MRKLPVLFLLLFSVAARAQESCSLRITLLTCSPGEELYSTFGHTALRVQDSAGTDLVFNYGTFEFSPDFYMQFVRGKLLYYLSVERFEDFLYGYRYESRSIVEQELLLDCTRKQELYRALMVNAREEHRYYRYDFLFDNCTTRAGKIVEAHVPGMEYSPLFSGDHPSFRDMIHTYLDRGGQYWSKLGIDILLGARLDRTVTNREAMFLPDYLLKGFDSARVSGKPLVTAARPVLRMPSPLNKGSIFRPAVVFSALLALFVLLFFLRTNWARRLLGILDFLLFFMLGLAGLLLLFMWFGTDHAVCRDNLNLLWALPAHLVFIFLTGRAAGRTYFRAVFWLTAALLPAWAFLPQEMNNALLPLVVLVLFRSWFLSQKEANGTKRA